MLVIEVFKPTYQRVGIKKDGTEFKVNYQEAEIRRQSKRPKPIEISVPRDGAYVEGLYTLADSSFRPDEYDRLCMAPFFRLVPLNDAIRIAQDAESATNVKPKPKN